MTRVVHIQYSTSSAGSAALRLQNAFIKENIESNIVSLLIDNKNSNEGISCLSSISRRIAWIDYKLQSFLTSNRIKKFGMFSYPILGTDVTHMEAVAKADVIYIHWALGGFLNFNSIKKLAQLNKPIFIFMHDMWAITGGCHHSFTCEKYMTECNNCQMFQGQKKNDLSRKGFKKKLNIYSKFDNLYFVSPSQWLYNCAKKSFLTKDKPIFHIPNLLDETIFKPFDKNTAKQILNIEPDETVIAFGAVSIDSPYKGWYYLQKALEILKQDNSLQKISILIFGSGYNKQIADAIPFKTKFLGFLDNYSITITYNATDVFIVPSLADNLPTTILECMSCGSPVVGFDVGGIPDMISHKGNGYLAKYKDSEDLAEGIKFCLHNNIKGYMLNDFKSSLIVKKHLDLIKYVNKY